MVQVLVQVQLVHLQMVQMDKLKLLSCLLHQQVQENILLTVTNWGTTASNTNQFVFNALGESATCVFTNSKWYVVANLNATIVN